MFRLIHKTSVSVMSSPSIAGVRKIMMNTEKELQEEVDIGYMYSGNIIQLSALCGFLPPVCFTVKELPRSASSGSNKFITKFICNNKKKITYKMKDKLFKTVVRKIKDVSSDRITASDLENVMCELHRASKKPSNRKWDLIFWLPSKQKFQHFFRVHKTNVSSCTSVNKWKLQMLHHNKWETIDKQLMPWCSLFPLNEATEMEEHNMSELLLCKMEDSFIHIQDEFGGE